MDWISLLQTFGLPVVCLFALATAVWRALIFLGANILKPLADRHIAFIDKLQEVIESQHSETTRLVRQHESVATRIETIAKKIEEIATALTEVKSVVIKTPGSVVITKGDDHGQSAGS